MPRRLPCAVLALAVLLALPSSGDACEVVEVAAVGTHVVFLKEDGTAWHAGSRQPVSWPPTLQGSLVPKLIPGAPPIVHVALDDSVVLLTASDGTLWSWAPRSGDPVVNQLTAFSGVDRVAGGATQAFALLQDTSLLAWGDNAFGQLGTGNQLPLPVSTPRPVLMSSGPRLDRVVRVSTFTVHSLAVRDDDTLWSWGRGDEGQLGVPGSMGLVRSRAQQVDLGVPVRAVAAGFQHSLVLDANGAVWSFGDPSWSALGRTGAGDVPATVPGLPPIVAIAAGVSSSFAVDDAGGLWTWGLSSSGVLGLGVFGVVSEPRLVTALDRGVVDLSVAAVALALMDDGSTRVWGDGGWGELGVGGVPTGLLPREVVPSSDAPHVGLTTIGRGAMSAHSLSTGSSGVFSWGAGAHHELGLGPFIGSNRPALVAGLGPATSLAAGERFSLAGFSDGTVMSWGWNDKGQLGTGACCGHSPSPVAVAGLDTAVELAAGTKFALARLSDGRVMSWGTNSSGQLGTGSPSATAVPQPVEVVGLADAVSIAAGEAHALAATTDGRVLAWGAGGGGRLGLGDTAERRAPVEVAGLPPILQVAAGRLHSLALGGDGSVWAWGASGDGQCGGDAVSSQLSPVRVAGLPDDLVTVAAGGLSSYAIDRDGRVWAWGHGRAGQLGDGLGASRPTPRPVVGLADVVGLGTGEWHALALDSSDRVWAWGSDDDGQLGRGDEGAWPATPREPHLGGGEDGIGDTLRLAKAGGDVRFSWEPVLLADLYKVRGDLDPAWSGPAVLGTDPAAEITLTPEPGTWFYRVAGVDCRGVDLP